MPLIHPPVVVSCKTQEMFVWYEYIMAIRISGCKWWNNMETMGCICAFYNYLWVITV